MKPKNMGRRALSALVLVVAALVSASSAASATASVSWTAESIASPTRFSPNDSVECESPLGLAKCDQYRVVVLNTGDTASSGPVTLTDILPAGMTTLGSAEPQMQVFSEERPGGQSWSCTGAPEQLPLGKASVVTCSLGGSIPAGEYAPVLEIPVTAPAPSPTKTPEILKNTVTVEGGLTAHSPITTADQETENNPTPPMFGITGFSFEPLDLDGSESGEAGGHPNALTTNIDFATVFTPPGTGESRHPVIPVEQVKSVIVELPMGFVGDPQAVPGCLQSSVGNYHEFQLNETCASTGSQIGVVAFDNKGTIHSTGDGATSKVYNVVPEAGYPDEFGFSWLESGVTMYASVIHNDSGYRLRVAAPGVTTTVSLTAVTLTLFGNPSKRNGAAGTTAFLTNPAACSVEGPLVAKVEADSWEHPEHWVSKTAVAYPQLEDCNLLQFDPKLGMAPSPSGEEGTSRADEPSGYDVNLEVPQTSLFEEAATPDLRDASVTLPEGVSVSPSASDGLKACQASGPEGIDIANGEGRHPDEAGEGETIGPDGLSHLTAGHCPGASTLGTVEVVTPLLASPLKGHVFLAQPKCGGEGQPACTEASASNGELFGLYLEVAGSGVVLKLPGSVAANPVTGQLTGTFTENPQLPFSDLKIRFHGGPRAPLANPQACGSYTTTSTLTSWGGQEASGASPSFAVDWDGKGGACPASLPFSPGFSAGTTSPVAGGYSSFVLSFSRQDREQDFSRVSVTLPPGLLGKIAGVPLCGEEQANTGTCGPESLLGSASVLSGPGEDPLYVSGGRVYLTTGYKGAPFGLSVVVPAVAGPFNLGNVIVREAIRVNPNTGQITVTSDRVPQSKDGVPFRLRTVNVEITRSGFTFNPTNCAQQQIVGAITSAQNTTADVSSPFAVTGCTGLPFKPSFTVSTQAKTSKARGASLSVRVGSSTGQANIAKVHVTVPKQLPSRLTTLQKACTEAQFNTNPAGCPAASLVGTAVAHTPILNSPLTGPGYLVSHGGAAFPDLVFVLQGEGITLVLDGNTSIKKGITSETFNSVPDAPISTFETVFPEGPHSVLATDIPVKAKGSMCGLSLRMPTTITGQNGAVITQNTKISVTGCPKEKVKKVKKKAKKVKSHHGKGSKGNK